MCHSKKGVCKLDRGYWDISKRHKKGGGSSDLERHLWVNVLWVGGIRKEEKHRGSLM